MNAHTPHVAPPHAWRLTAGNPWARKTSRTWPATWLLLCITGVAVIGCGEFVRYAPLNDQAKRGQSTAPPSAETASSKSDSSDKRAADQTAKPESNVASASKRSAGKAEAKSEVNSAAPHPPDRVPTSGQSSLAQWCDSLVDRLFSVKSSQCRPETFTDTGFRSVQGRVIASRDVAARSSSSLGRVLLIGGTHGDELTSVSLTFWWLQLLDEQRSKFEWRIVPAMNPDGVLAEPPRRVNANNVDLNRNMPTPGWATASRAYWQEVGREPRRYPGEKAASEPETRWLVHAVEHYKPDVIISLHAPYGVLDYDGVYPPPLELGGLRLQRLGVFPGSLGNYGSRYLGIPVMTVELDHATRMPSQADAEAMWRDLNAWLEQYLSTLRQVDAVATQTSG